MQQNLSRQITCQARIFQEESDEEILSSYSKLFSTIERKLFADFCKGKTFASLKNAYLKQFGITARQYNSICITLEGKIRSYKELLSLRITEQKSRIESTKSRIAYFEKKEEKKAHLHQVKRRLGIQLAKLKNLQKDKNNNKVRLCFGGKKLFANQFNLEKNGFSSHEEWKNDWQHKRNGQFFVIGSKDESLGNQSCQILQQEDGLFTLTLRLPNGFCKKYLTVPNLKISYRKEDLLACIEANLTRKILAKQKSELFRKTGQAINYRFIKDEKGWRVFISFSKVKSFSDLDYSGCIGIDINVNHLALAETDRHGNLVCKKTFPLNLYGKSKEQTKALIGDVSADIVDFAKSCNKPIVLEKLDFSRKKASLNRRQKKKSARMLSSFAYSKIIETIQGRAFEQDIPVHQVNPAYTSIIGKVNYCRKYGLSSHLGAAFIIARRYLGLSERPCCNQAILPDGKNGYVTFSLPERNREKHGWSYWAEVLRKLKAVYVKHHRRERISSLDPPSVLETTVPKIVSEISHARR